MTSLERVMCVLRNEQPDRIPHFEWILDHRVREAIFPGCSMEEFTLRMGLDAILTAPDIQRESIGENRWRNEYGVILERNEEEYSFPIKGPIKTMEDLANYQPPDPRAPGRFASLKKLVDRYKGQLAIGVHLNDVFSIPRALLGYENFLMALAAEPELAQGVIDLSVEMNITFAKECARLGADFVMTGDDYASTERPLVSPTTFREMLLPGAKRVFASFKEFGLMTIKHTDGNLGLLVDQIVEIGMDCLDPIDPISGMDIGDIKRRFGDCFAIKGNVDCAYTLTFGSMADVVEETKRVIAAAGEGGGLIVSSSNSIHSKVKPENYLAMVNAIRTYGTYPLKLDGFEPTGAVAAFS